MAFFKVISCVSGEDMWKHYSNSDIPSVGTPVQYYSDSSKCWRTVTIDEVLSGKKGTICTLLDSEGKPIVSLLNRKKWYPATGLLYKFIPPCPPPQPSVQYKGFPQNVRPSSHWSAQPPEPVNGEHLRPEYQAQAR